MNEHLESKIRHARVANLGNSPAITGDLRLGLTNFGSQSLSPRINRGAHKRSGTEWLD